MSTPFYRTKSANYAEFLTSYAPDQAAEVLDAAGRTLLHAALSNHDVAARIAIANQLLDDGADAAAISRSDNINALHILFGSTKHDYEAEQPLLKRLLDGGADVNLVSKRFGSPLHPLARQFETDDATLAPFYDELFARDDLDLLTPVAHGLSTLELVRKWRMKRENLLERFEQYLMRRGQLPDQEEDNHG